MDVPFINRLPPELLVVITTFINQSTTFRLATVCRHWHDVLTGAATLWTSIDCRSESRTSILLQRSKFIPIDVTVDHAHYVPEAVSLVANHTHRMRSIDVTLLFRLPKVFRSLLYGSAPVLKAIRMQGYAGFTRFRFPLYNSFFQGRPPALRTLCLKGYPFDLSQSPPMMTNGLTTLVLNNGQTHQLRDLLEYLGHCKNLEHLEIDLPRLQGTVLTSRIASLPKLRELRLVGLPSTIHRHLSFPPSADLAIHSLVRVYAEGCPPTDVWTEDGLPHILESRTIKDIKMTFTGPDCVVGLEGSHLDLTVLVVPYLPHPSSFHSDFLGSFEFLPTETTEFFGLVLLQPYPFDGTLRYSCTRLLTQMSALKQITLCISTAPFFIRALEPVDGDLLCPKLRELILIRRENDEVDLRNSLLALSNQRKDHGCPLICSIGLHNPSVCWNIAHPERVV
jgi:hypothetical protein